MLLIQTQSQTHTDTRVGCRSAFRNIPQEPFTWFFETGSLALEPRTHLFCLGGWPGGLGKSVSVSLALSLQAQATISGFFYV